MSFLVTGDSRLITSSYDDMIIVWDFDNGSIIQRISIRASGAQIQRIVYKDETIFVGSYDMKVRQIDLVAGRVVKTLDIFAPVQEVLTGDDVLYLATRSSPYVLKVSMVDGRQLMSYVGHTETSFSMLLYEDLLLSGSADNSILCWRKNSGELVQSFLGHSNLVFVVAVYDGSLYSAGTEAIIIKWNLNDGQILKKFPQVHSETITCFAYSSQKLYTGSFDSSIVVWNLTSFEPTNSYKGKVNKLNAVAIWKNFIFGAGSDGQIRLWNQLLESNEVYSTLHSSLSTIFCLHVHENILYSGSSDQTVLRWNLATLSLLESLESPSRGILSITSDQSFIYAGGSNNVIYHWNVSSGILTGSFSGHSNLIRSLICEPQSLISGSSDRSVRIWNLNTQTNDKVFGTFFGITGLVLNEDRIVACTDVGLEEFSISLGEKTLFFQDVMACLSIAFNGRQIFSGHDDATIRIRDLSTLAIIDTYRSHTDYVTSLCFDDFFGLYSASNDGSVKKWNMAARRVAFSFENRNDSVTALAALGDQLFVGLRRGLIVEYSILNASKFQSFDYHTRELTSLVSDGDLIYSAGLDGLIVQFSAVSYESFTVLHDARDQPLKSLTMNSMFLFALQEETKLVTLSKGFNRTISITELEQPLVCITATDSEVIAGSRSGIIYAWNIENFDLEFELKGHVSQVNQVLIVDSRLFSASSDKAIIEWSLSSKNLVRVYERISASALGHLGPVNSISYCNGVLFSAGADLSVRRWNLQTGRHEEVYFGFSKPVTTVLCHNYSVFAGSEDFSVLMFKPNLPQIELTQATSTKTSEVTSIRRPKIIFKSSPSTTSWFLIDQIIPLIFVSAILVLAAALATLFWFQRNNNDSKPAFTLTTSNADTNQTTTDLKTFINTSMGISKHAAYLIENSKVAKIKMLTKGGGGEVSLANMIDSAMRIRYGELVIQKIVSVDMKNLEETFYQEVGIMIMLNSFPHFCKIIGYTEKPLSMVLQYYPNGSLFDWIRKNELNKTFMKFLIEISTALSTMHSHHLAHCDIKTQNILVHVENRIPSCVLTDFGITQVLSDTILAAKTFSLISIKGLSVHYAAPEAFIFFRSKRFSSANFKKYDIYSFACVTYEILIRNYPWSNH